MQYAVCSQILIQLLLKLKLQMELGACNLSSITKTSAQTAHNDCLLWEEIYEKYLVKWKIFV